jgi:hypothetical protein
MTASKDTLTPESIANLRRELGKLNISDDDIAHVIKWFGDNPTTVRIINDAGPDAALWNFKEKTITLLATLKEHGVQVNCDDYIKAALKHPSLFTRNPETIARHFMLIWNHAEELWNKHIDFPKPTQKTKHQPREARLLGRILEQPNMLCLSDKNLVLRQFHADHALAQKRDDISWGCLYADSLTHAETAAVSALGGDSASAIPKTHAGKLTKDMTLEEKANLGLRALVRGGIINAKLQEGRESPSMARNV